MKKITIYMINTALLLIFSGCSDWLAVKPKTEVRQNEMFQTAGGFKDALTGVYIQLKSNAIYGRNLTLTTTEHMAQHWKVSSGSSEAALANFEYQNEGVESTFSSLWQQMYKVIAHINNILVHIDEKQGVFEDGMYELVKGEALALRAYCHFDLLRLWGPVPGKTDEVAGTILPYVTSLLKTAHPHHTYDEIIRLIGQDMEQAEELLGKADPILKWDNMNLNNLNAGFGQQFIPEDPFWYYRQYRLNYYALKGLQARFYLWTGDKEKAYDAAKVVYDAKNQKGEKQFRLGTSADLTKGDRVFTVEHLLGLSVVKLSETVESLFEGDGALEKEETLVKQDLLENQTSDLRGGFWEELIASNQTRKYVYTKYKQSATKDSKDSQSPFDQVIPLMRLSEIYMILTECAPMGEALQYFNELRLSRNLNTVELNEGNRMEMIVKECRREFYGEGVMFFLYKRLGMETILWTDIKGSTKVYVVPKPKNA